MTSKPGLCRLVCSLLLAASSSSFAAPLPEPAEDDLPLNVGDGAWEKTVAERTERHLKAWLSSSGEERLKEAGALVYYAWRAERLDLIDRVIADDRLAETEVKVADGAVSVSITGKHESLTHHADAWPGDFVPVWRRITSSAFEIWTPVNGWLFDRSGRLVHTATPPRKSGLGRQWFGAFLPDGRWITTELFEGDGRVYIFNTKDRCTHEIKGRTLLIPPGAKDGRELSNIIPWARANRKGDAWVVRVGSEEGRGEIVLKPDGSWIPIEAPSSPWRHCPTRQLGVRLSAGIAEFSSESDDGRLALSSSQPSHGMNVGNPGFRIRVGQHDLGEKPPADVMEIGNIPGSGRVFGFWPGSHAVYVQGTSRTWFFDAKGQYQGWIAGRRVGDAANGKDMLFCLEDGRVVAVSPKLKAGQPQRYVLPDGTSPPPVELHPDIGLGIFALSRARNTCGEPDNANDEKEDLRIEVMENVSNWLSQRSAILLATWKSEATKKGK